MKRAMIDGVAEQRKSYFASVDRELRRQRRGQAVKRCKHSSRWMDVTVHNIVLWKCVSCDEVLSLGPAADDKPEVQIEIRAAEIAVEGPTGWRNTGELLGLLLGSHPVEDYASPGDDSEHAGYLARLIYEHM